MFGLYNTLQGTDHSNSQKPSLLRGPGYYDKPEGTDPIGKLWGINKYAIYSGLCATVFDCVAISHAQNVPEIANIAGFWFAPLIGCATTFASVTYIAADYRKKDDKLNYCLGALACAPIIHAWRKNFDLTCRLTIFLMVGAWLKKDSIENGWTFAGQYQARYGNYWDESSGSLVSEEWPKRPY